MKRYSSRLMTMVLLLVLIACSLAQHGRRLAGRDTYGIDFFQYHFYNFADTTDAKQSRVDFHFALVNDILTFLKNDHGKYQAGYEITVTVYNDKDEPLVNEFVDSTVIVERFSETNWRDRPHRHKISFSLPPGEYRYVIQLYDEQAEETLIRKDDMVLREFSPDRVHLSDIVFLDAMDSTGGTFTYTPNLSRIYNDLKSAFAAYFEVYPPTSQDSVTLTFKIFSSSEGRLVTHVDRFAGPGPVRRVIRFRDYVHKPGEYLLQIHATDGAHAASARRKFFVHWGNVRLQENNIDVAIEQLSLIAKKELIEEMRKADERKRKEMFDRFWAQRDPTPGTPRNELREEFFRRIDFANRNFSEVVTGRLGWQTDRGKVYIKNGPPDEIEREAAEINMPKAEIWYYASLDRRYIFSDRRGNGVYRLVKIE